MKHIIGMLIILTTLNAWAEDGKLHLQGSWRTEVKSAYVAEIGCVVHDDLVWENELTLRLGKTGFYGGIWSSFPFEKTNPVEPEAEEEAEAPTFEDERLANLYQLLDSTRKLCELLDPPAEPAPPFEGEIDLYFGYAHVFEKLTLDFSLLYYDFNEVGKYNDDQWSAQLIGTYTGFKWFEPYLRVNYYGETGNKSPEGGWYVFPGANFHIPLGFKLSGEKEQTLDLGIRGAWSSGVLGMDSGYIYTRLSASTDFRLWQNAFLTPSIMYQIAGLGQTGSDKDYVDGDKWVFGLGFRIEF